MRARRSFCYWESLDFTGNTINTGGTVEALGAVRDTKATFQFKSNRTLVFTLGGEGRSTEDLTVVVHVALGESRAFTVFAFP